MSFNPAPAGCNGTDNYRMHAHIDTMSANSDALLSSLLAAYTADLEVSAIWYKSGGFCNSSGSLALTAIEFKKK